MRAQRSLVVAGFLVVFVLGFWVAGHVRATSSNAYDDWNLLASVFTQVRDNYVEPVNDDKLLQAAIRGMLRSLDPHSQFLDTKEYTDLQTTTHGSFGGIGIQIGVRNNFPTVISPIEGTPAYLLGIQTGDRIVTIDGKSSEGLTLDQVVNKLRGQKGTKVRIGIAREGEEKILNFTITRDVIEVRSVPYAFMLPSGVGYVRLTTFAENTADELQDALQKFQAQNAKGLIIDLRWNPGGLLSQAVEVSQMFVPRGKEVVETRPRAPRPVQPYYSQNAHPYSFPTVVLVNGGSASASEIFAGAIQDQDLGLVVGTLSYGKGSVQTIIPLQGQQALKLTTAKWYTPSGRCIHKDEGERELVQADDVEQVGDDDPTADPTDDNGAGAADAAKEKANKPKYRTLDRHRIVYGGGGITPDVEIKPDKLTSLESKVEGRGLFFNFAVKYYARHKDLGTAPVVTEPMFSDFVQLLRDEKIDFTQDEVTRDRAYLERGIRREFARRQSGDEAAFKVAMEGDNQLQSAVDLLSKYKTTARLLDYAVAPHTTNEAAH
jgi:carboxyl-terminal processing protease